MRPRQSSLGIRMPSLLDSSRSAAPSASMRPRQSSLGIAPVTRTIHSPVFKSGFNEAEAIKPRNRLICDLRTVILSHSFNEAEAIKPRNQTGQAQRARCQDGSARFNEAEAIKPRNPGRRAEAPPRRDARASMRPRQSSLGIVAVAVSLAREEKASLQ